MTYKPLGIPYLQRARQQQDARYLARHHRAQASMHDPLSEEAQEHRIRAEANTRIANGESLERKVESTR